jgi:hypothetical protein
MPGRARFDPDSGFIQSGIRSVKKDSQGDSEIPVCMTFTMFEGQHERSAGLVFNLSWTAMGLTKQQFLDNLTGSVINFSIARLLYNIMAGPYVPITKGGVEKWAFKIYGVAEDQFQFGRQLETAAGYEWTYMNRWYPRIHHKTFNNYPSNRGFAGLNARRYQADSYFYHREHTVAATFWEWPSTGTASPHASQGTAPVPPPQSNEQGAPQPWSTPDITAVIREIVSRPGFLDGNRLGLVLGFDGCWDDLTTARLSAANPGGGPGGGPMTFAFAGDADFFNAGTCQPTLQTYNPELRLTVGP